MSLLVLLGIVGFERSAGLKDRLVDWADNKSPVKKDSKPCGH